MLFVIPTILLLAAGCGGHSVLEPSGEQASRIVKLWWIFTWTTVAVYLLVIVFLTLPVWRNRARLASPRIDPPDLTPEPRLQQRLSVAVGAAVAITAIVLVVLTISDFLTQRALGSLATEPNPLTLRITGHQWWWKIEYLGSIPSNIVTTANEIHIPVGRAVRVELQSADVIHSFWVPQLHGKKDLVTGHPTTIWLNAKEAGTYFGQCAEFCGYQHAKMKIIVVAEPAEKFESWLSAQRQPAPAPQTESQQRGYAIFMSQTCVLCHTIDGTPAAGQTAPNLTHLASRQRIAGNSYPNTRGYLAGWILDPQHLKPGVRMPQHNLSADELHALLDYLQMLK